MNRDNMNQDNMNDGGMNDGGMKIIERKTEDESRIESKAGGIFRKAITTILITLWIVYAIVLAAFWLNDRAGQGARTVVTVGGAIVVGLATLIWFVLASRFSSKSRFAALIVSILAVVGLASIVRVQEVNGSLIPTFRFAWDAMPDERLANIATDVALESGIDLTATPHDFPQFLGPERNAAIDGVSLDPDWESNPPRLKWKQEIGAGWSAFAAVNGFAVTMEQRGAEELVSCYEIETGKVAWIHAIEARHATVFGGVGPRATPVIHQGRVFALGGTGVLRCLDGANGAAFWTHDLIREFGGDPDHDFEAIAWGRAGSPLIVDQLVVAPVGGPVDGDKISLIAFRQDNGKEVWRAGDVQIGYSSPQLLTIDGVRQIVCTLESAVCSFAPETGEKLWELAWPGSSTAAANCSQAVQVDSNRLLASKGYGKGAELVDVRKSENEWKLESLWAKPTSMKTKFATPVYHNGFVYGLNDVILECLDVENGRTKWKRGRYGYGQILRVGEHILVQAEDGRVLLVEATPSELVELGSIDAIEGKTWNHLCLYGTYLLVRNGNEAACYELPIVNLPPDAEI